MPALFARRRGAAPPTIGATMTRLDATALPPGGRPRKPGEAAHFFRDQRFASDAVRVLPGEYFVSADDLIIATTLGSCVAVCLWDPLCHAGGMNHIVLPGDTMQPADDDGAAGRYGSFAMELLVNALLAAGALRHRLLAKVFGGAAVLRAVHARGVGERNVRFALDYLATERIEVVSRDVLGTHPRKVVFWPMSGRAMVKKLPLARARELVEREAVAPPPAAGSIDLF